MTKHMRHCVMT